MTVGLDGTVALVTGASSGIGEATARVAVAARRKDRLEALAASIDGQAAIEADITDRTQAQG